MTHANTHANTHAKYPRNHIYIEKLRGWVKIAVQSIVFGRTENAALRRGIIQNGTPKLIGATWVRKEKNMKENKWGLYGLTPEESIEEGTRYLCEYDENTSDVIAKDMTMCWMNYLDAISKALVEIRDVLKGDPKDAPKSKWTEKPWGLLCPNCGHPALNYPNGKDAHSPYCPWCGSEMEVDNDGNT